MEKEITLAHGAGGEAYRALVEQVFLPAYGSDELNLLGNLPESNQISLFDFV